MDKKYGYEPIKLTTFGNYTDVYQRACLAKINEAELDQQEELCKLTMHSILITSGWHRISAEVKVSLQKELSQCDMSYVNQDDGAYYNACVKKLNQIQETRTQTNSCFPSAIAPKTPKDRRQLPILKQTELPRPK